MKWNEENNCKERINLMQLWPFMLCRLPFLWRKRKKNEKKIQKQRKNKKKILRRLSHSIDDNGKPIWYRSCSGFRVKWTTVRLPEVKNSSRYNEWVNHFIQSTAEPYKTNKDLNKQQFSKRKLKVALISSSKIVFPSKTFFRIKNKRTSKLENAW